MSQNQPPHFAPQLYVPSGITDISFYRKAFGADELRRWNNDDGSLHIAELSIGSALFHIHEATGSPDRFAPKAYNGTTVVIGLFVNDVDEVMHRAIAAGAL